MEDDNSNVVTMSEHADNLQNDERTCRPAGTVLTQRRSAPVRGSKLSRGSVYFIRAGNKIKIGFSTRPLDRLNRLQTAHHDKLEILGTMPGTMETEAGLHQLFHRYRVRGEWFTDSPDILRFIEIRTPEGQARVKARPVPAHVRREPPSPAVLEFKAIGRQLSSKRSKLPEAARPFVSNLIEQIDQIVDDVSLERMRPHMAYQQRRLSAALAS